MMPKDILDEISPECQEAFNRAAACGKSPLTRVSDGAWNKVVGFTVDKLISVWNHEAVQHRVKQGEEQTLQKTAIRFEQLMWSQINVVFEEHPNELWDKAKDSKIVKALVMFFLGISIEKICFTLADYFHQRGNHASKTLCLKLARTAGYMATNTIVDNFGVEAWLTRIVKFGAAFVDGIDGVDPVDLPAQKDKPKKTFHG